MTASMFPISFSSKYGMMFSNKLWIDFRKNNGGLVISEMNISFRT